MTTVRPLPSARPAHPTRVAAGIASALALAAALLAPAPASAAEPTTIDDAAGLATAVTAASAGSTVHVELADDIISDGTLSLSAGSLVIDLAGHDLEIWGDENTGPGAGDDGGPGLIVAPDARLVIVGPGEAFVSGGWGEDGADGADGDDGDWGDWGTHGAAGDAAGGDGGDGGDGETGDDGAPGEPGGDGGDGGDGLVSAGVVVVIGADLVAVGGDGGYGGRGGDGGDGGRGGDGGYGGSATADDPEADGMSTGGRGGDGGDGGAGGDGGDGGSGGAGGLGFVNHGILALFEGAQLPGDGSSGEPGSAGDTAELGEAGDTGESGHPGWPLDRPDQPVPGNDGLGGVSGDGGYGGDGGSGGWGGESGARGEGLAPSGSGSIVASSPLGALPPTVQTIVLARLHAENGTGDTWFAHAVSLDEVTTAFEAAALGGLTLPSYPQHTLLGWALSSDTTTLVEADLAFGQQTVDLSAVWEENPAPPADDGTGPAGDELAQTGADPAVPLAAAGGLLLLGGLALAAVRSRRRRAA